MKNTDSFYKTFGIPIDGGNLLIVADSSFLYTEYNEEISFLDTGSVKDNRLRR